MTCCWKKDESLYTVYIYCMLHLFTPFWRPRLLMMSSMVVQIWRHNCFHNVPFGGLNVDVGEEFRFHQTTFCVVVVQGGSLRLWCEFIAGHENPTTDSRSREYPVLSQMFVCLHAWGLDYTPEIRRPDSDHVERWANTFGPRVPSGTLL